MAGSKPGSVILKIRKRDGQVRWLTDRSIELLDDQKFIPWFHRHPAGYYRP